VTAFARSGASSRAVFRGVDVRSPRSLGRAVELASTAVGLGVAGHVLGGSSVSPAVLLPAFIPLLILAKFCSRKELSSTVIGLTLVLGQSWVHMLASLTDHGQAMNGSSMMVGHAVATVIALLILRRREAVRWTKSRSQAIAAYVVAVLSFGAGFPLAAPRQHHVQTSHHPVDPISPFIGVSLARRGPPCGHAF
jgi:hypothetical protein